MSRTTEAIASGGEASASNEPTPGDPSPTSKQVVHKHLRDADWKQLYKLTYRMIESQVRQGNMPRPANQERMAEDLVVEVSLKTLEKADSYDASQGEFLPWFAGFVSKTLLSEHRDRKRNREQFADTLRPADVAHEDWEESQLFAELRHASERGENGEVPPEVHRHLSRLEEDYPKDKDILIQFYFRDKSLAQIAEEEKIREGTAKTRLYRARGRLRDVIEAEEQFAGDP